MTLRFGGGISVGQKKVLGRVPIIGLVEELERTVEYFDKLNVRIS